MLLQDALKRVRRVYYRNKKKDVFTMKILKLSLPLKRFEALHYEADQEQEYTRVGQADIKALLSDYSLMLAELESAGIHYESEDQYYIDKPAKIPANKSGGKIKLKSKKKVKIHER